MMKSLLKKTRFRLNRYHAWKLPVNDNHPPGQLKLKRVLVLVMVVCILLWLLTPLR